MNGNHEGRRPDCSWTLCARSYPLEREPKNRLQYAMPWVALPLLILLPGGAVLLAFGAPRPVGAALWRAGAAGLLIASWCALALAQLSLFSIVALSASLAFGSVALLVLRRRRVAATWSVVRELPRTPVPKAVALALGALVLAAGALAARPGEHFGGGWDPGTYLAAGGSVAHRGGLITHDPLLASLDGRERDLLFPLARTRGIKYPGFYVHDLKAGTLIPQFQPLYPALLAVAISLFGDRAALYVNPAFAIASLLLLFHLAWVWRGRAFALAAAALFAFNVVQVWNSRFSTSEMTAQVVLLAGFVFLEDFLARGDTTAGALSGLAFGMAPLATVTTVLVVPFAFAAAVWPGGGTPRAGRWAFTIALAVALSHLALWSVFVDPKYLAQVTHFFPDAPRWLIPGGTLFTTAAWVAWSPSRRRALVTAISGSAAAAATAALLLLGLAWFWWGQAAAGPTAGAPALIKLSWFLTPWVLIPFACGGAALLAQGRRRSERAFLLAGLGMLFFFLYEPRMYPTYPFTLRRYTPLAIPVIACAAAVLPAALLQASHVLLRAGGAVLLALALALPLVKNWDLVRRTEYDGAGKLIADVDARLPRGGILVCEGPVPAGAFRGDRRIRPPSTRRRRTGLAALSCRSPLERHPGVRAALLPPLRFHPPCAGTPPLSVHGPKDRSGVHGVPGRGARGRRGRREPSGARGSRREYPRARSGILRRESDRRRGGWLAGPRQPPRSPFPGPPGMSPSRSQFVSHPGSAGASPPVRAFSWTVRHSRKKSSSRPA